MKKKKGKDCKVIKVLLHEAIQTTGQVKKPRHLFVDSADNILVADYGNHRIQVFHQNGNLIKSIGTGQLSSPAGICMDREGRIIVSEGDGHRISIF